jgi:hypothetical protein
MFQTKQRRFRGRANGRRHTSHRNGSGQNQPRVNTFTNSQPRNNFRPFQSAQKLLEKYTNLAKEAMSAGDKTLSENYLQHADHFIRVIDEKNKNRPQTNSIENNNNTESEITKNDKSESIVSQSSEDK